MPINGTKSRRFIVTWTGHLNFPHPFVRYHPALNLIHIWVASCRGVKLNFRGIYNIRPQSHSKIEFIRYYFVNNRFINNPSRVVINLLS